MAFPLILTNAMSSDVVCEVQVSRDMSLKDVCQQAFVLTAPLEVVIFKDGKVFDGDIQLRDIGLEEGGSVGCVKMTPANARAARQKAKLERLLATSLEQFLPVMPKNLSLEPFGKELAALAALSLRAGESVRGRLRFNYRTGVMTTTTDDFWTLGVDTVLVSQSCGLAGQVGGAPEEVDGLTIVWRIGGEEVALWQNVEEFEQFWAVMSEQKTAALMAGLGAEPGKVSFVSGNVTHAQLKQLAKFATAEALAPAPTPVLARVTGAFVPVMANPEQLSPNRRRDGSPVRGLQAHEDAFCLGTVAPLVAAPLSSAARAAAVHVDQSKPMCQIRVCFNDGSHKVVSLNDDHTIGDLRCLCSSSEALELKPRLPGATPLVDDSISLRAAGLLKAVVIARPQKMSRM